MTTTSPTRRPGAGGSTRAVLQPVAVVLGASLLFLLANLSADRPGAVPEPTLHLPQVALLVHP